MPSPSPSQGSVPFVRRRRQHDHNLHHRHRRPGHLYAPGPLAEQVEDVMSGETPIPLKFKHRDPANVPVRGVKKQGGGNGRRAQRGHLWLKDKTNR